MNTIAAFFMGEANRGNPLMVFDWEEAARRIALNPTDEYYAALEGDEEYNFGLIFDNGDLITPDWLYLASVWATPVLNEVPCYRFKSELESEGKYWDWDTMWPDEAIQILKDAGVLS